MRHEIANGRVVAEHKAWPVRYMRMFDMTNDSDKFITRTELENQGWKPAPLNRWRRTVEAKKEEAVPLYVGRMVNIYDHRASSVTVNEENVRNAALSSTISDNEKADASVFPIPQYWVRIEDVPEPLRRPWVLAFRDIARSTDVRTCISAFVPNTARSRTYCSNTSGVQAS